MRPIIFLFAIAYAIACKPIISSTNAMHQQDSSNAISEVKRALDEQVKAWNKAELEKAMSYYWNSPEMLWISRRGVEKGYQQVLDGYKKDFNDKSKMGVYSYEPLYIEALSKDAVYYVLKWKIELNGKRIMGGTSSQIWKVVNNKWVVTIEHAS